ncbi:MAG: transcriptional regulator NrdR [Myxococcota bacterium]|nr:transcriptional regulator NrdR [Myxococcota bacterium]
MRCPSCGDETTRVIDTRVGRDGDEIRRRRECEECGRRFTTRERLEVSLPQVIKRDLRREEYERRKLVAGITRACVKRPVSADAIARLADRVEAWLHEAGEREISSGSIGDRIMQELKALDKLAAIRFASVYQAFETTGDYAAFMEALEAESGNE